jgi:prephenate dehydratase
VLTKPEGAEQTGKQRFNYLFYIDFVGALSDPVCQNALRHLQVGKLAPASLFEGQT